MRMARRPALCRLVCPVPCSRGYSEGRVRVVRVESVLAIRVLGGASATSLAVGGCGPNFTRLTHTLGASLVAGLRDLVARS